MDDYIGKFKRITKTSLNLFPLRPSINAKINNNNTGFSFYIYFVYVLNRFKVFANKVDV